MDQIVVLAKSLSSANRLETLKSLMHGDRPVDIADDLGISRAGLQKHLESLLNAGLLVKTGSGRNTKYTPTPIVERVLECLKLTAEVLNAEKQVISLNAMYDTVDNADGGVIVNKEVVMEGILSAKNIQLKIVNDFIGCGTCPP